jgi:hypothetical protein
MIANIVKAMWDEYYTVRQCSLIAGCSYDYALKLVKGERGHRVVASVEDMTDTQLERKKILDILLSLRGYMFVDKTQKYAYIALLGYLGFTDTQIAMLYPHDRIHFIRQATHYSDKAWQDFDSTAIGMPREEYAKLWQLEGKNSMRKIDLENKDPHSDERRAKKMRALSKFQKSKIQ